MSKPDFQHDQKLAQEHVEDVKSITNGPEEVADVDAKGYVNHNIVIDEATNKRLRWLVHKRYVGAQPVVLFLF
jgi:uncharacterized Zn finger protein